MITRGITVPNNVKHELGVRKNVIRQQNLEIQEITLSRQLNAITSYLELNDSPLLERLQTDTVRNLTLNSFLQIPTFKRSKTDKLSIKNLQAKTIDIHQAPIKVFYPSNADEWQRQRQELLDLIKAATDEEVQIGFGSTDETVDKRDVLDAIQKEIQIIALKSKICENNESLQTDKLTDDEQRDIKLKNAEMFGKIAEIEGRNNTFELNKSLQDRKLLTGIVKKRALQKFSGKRFAKKHTNFFSRNLIYQLGAINHNREMALNAYEMDQATQREVMEMENYDI